MKYFLDPITRSVYAYESDEARANLGSPSLIPMTSEEVAAHLNPPLAEPTAAQTEAALTAALNRHLDAVAGERRYDSRFTCALRAGFPGPFQEEGQVFAAWMDACNMSAYQMMAEVKAGSREVPTEAELIAALPVIEWPPSPIPEGAA